MPNLRLHGSCSKVNLPPSLRTPFFPWQQWDPVDCIAAVPKPPHLTGPEFSPSLGGGSPLWEALLYVMFASGLCVLLAISKVASQWDQELYGSSNLKPRALNCQGIMDFSTLPGFRWMDESLMTYFFILLKILHLLYLKQKPTVMKAPIYKRANILTAWLCVPTDLHPSICVSLCPRMLVGFWKLLRSFTEEFTWQVSFPGLGSPPLVSAELPASPGGQC